MPTSTYTPLANVTLNGSSSSVLFSNIPNTYRDLVLVATGSTGSSQDIYLRFNNDSASNYSFVYMGGNGSGTASGANTADSVVLDGYFWRSGTQAVVIAQIMDYSATDKHKTVLSRNNVASGGVDAFANRWANTAAITSVRFGAYQGGTFTSGTTVSLYGIAG